MPQGKKEELYSWCKARREKQKASVKQCSSLGCQKSLPAALWNILEENEFPAVMQDEALSNLIYYQRKSGRWGGEGGQVIVCLGKFSQPCVFKTGNQIQDEIQGLSVGFLPQREENLCIPSCANNMQIRVITYLLRKFQLPHFGLKRSRGTKRECLLTVQSCQISSRGNKRVNFLSNKCRGCKQFFQRP